MLTFGSIICNGFTLFIIQATNKGFIDILPEQILFDTYMFLVSISFSIRHNQTLQLLRPFLYVVINVHVYVL